MSSYPNMSYCMCENTLSALGQVMEAMREVGIRRVVLASSGAIYGEQDIQPLLEHAVLFDHPERGERPRRRSQGWGWRGEGRHPCPCPKYTTDAGHVK